METPIVVKCVTCGMVLADKYMFYIEELCKRKLNNQNNEIDNIKYKLDKVIYLTNTYKEKTIEGKTLDEMNIDRMCCRRHFLTHVDIE
jgi:DNA-directed RNA polymerase I, II, and III subunit RPABC5